MFGTKPHTDFKIRNSVICHSILLYICVLETRYYYQTNRLKWSMLKKKV